MDPGLRMGLAMAALLALGSTRAATGVIRMVTLAGAGRER